jgi:hypothetical protein
MNHPIKDRECDAMKSLFFGWNGSPKMEAVGASETLTKVYQTTGRCRVTTYFFTLISCSAYSTLNRGDIFIRNVG